MAGRQGGVSRALALASAAVLVTTSLIAVAQPASAAPLTPGVPGAAGDPDRSAHPKAPALHHASDTVVLSPSTLHKAATAATTTPIKSVKGTGDPHDGTLLSFPLTDKLVAKVNVASGNLLVTGTDLTVPALGQDVAVGPVYNSLLIGSTAEVGDYGHGWRARSGKEYGLFDNGDGTLTYVDPTGAIGVFTASGSGYTGDGQFKATLATDGTGWKLTDHDTGDVTRFDSDGVVSSVTDRNGQAVTTAILADGESTVVGDRGATAPRTAAMDYNTANVIDKVTQTGTDGTSRVIAYGYDSSGNLTSITDATNQTTHFGYDASHDLTSIQPPVGKTTITYDSSHRVTSLTRWDTDTDEGAVTRLSFVSSTQTQLADANTDPSQAVSAVPHTTYTYNAKDLVTGVTDPDGHTQSKTYNNFNDVATSTDAYSAITTDTYGANTGESLTGTQLPTGASTSLAYAYTASTTNPTANFQPSSSTDSQSNTTAYTYNGTGNTLQSTDALAATAKVSYNSDGTVASSTDPANGSTSPNPTTYGYDSTKQLTTVTPPTGTTLGVRTFTYDAYDRLKTATDGAGRTTTYTYDKDDRVTAIAYSDGTTAVHYTFDGDGNVTVRTDATGETDYYFNTLNRLTDEGTSDFDNWHSYGYDWVGNITWFWDGRGTDEYTYDDRNLLAGMTTSDESLRYTFYYDNDGNRTITEFNSNASGSSSTAKTYVTLDSSQRIKSTTTTLNNDDDNVAYDTTYCYTAYVSGQACSTTGDSGLLRWKQDYAATITTYSYDTGNRVTAASGGGQSKGYSYNTNGDRTGVTTNGTSSQTLAFNPGNQISTVGYTYDGAGNQLTAPGDTGNTYNAAEQLLTSHNGGTTSTFTYAGTGQDELLSTKSGTVTTYYEYSQPDPQGVPQVSDFHTIDSSTGKQADYYIERDPVTEQPLGLQYITTDGVHHQYGYVVDGLGSVVNLVDTAGNLASTGYTYWPYGETRNTETVYDPINTTNILGYAAGVQAAGLTKFGTRWYDTTTGRFTQQDSQTSLANPANGNRYAYAADNPVTNSDPTGKCSIDSWISSGSALISSAGTAIGTWILAGVTTVPFVAGVVLLGSAAIGAIGAAGVITYCIFS